MAVKRRSTGKRKTLNAKSAKSQEDADTPLWENTTTNDHEELENENITPPSCNNNDSRSPRPHEHLNPITPDAGAKRSGDSINQSTPRDDLATSYVADCTNKMENLRKRKRDQEGRVENLVQNAFQQIELIVNMLMTSIQERHTTAQVHFDETINQMEDSLNTHNQVEKKLQAIAAILLGSQ